MTTTTRPPVSRWYSSHDALQARQVTALERVLGPDGEGERVVLHRGGQPAALGLRVREPERDLEHEQHEHRDREVAEEQSAAHGRSATRRARARRFDQPEPDAADRLDPRRVAELLAQRRDVDVERLRRPVPVRVPDLLEDVLAGADTAPGSPARSASRSNSLGVSAIARSPNVTWCVRRSIVSAPTTLGRRLRPGRACGRGA